MKKTFIFFILLSVIKAGNCQSVNDPLFYDNSFLKAYTKVAFVKIDNVAMIRKWNHDIKIYIEAKKENGYKKLVSGIIEKISQNISPIKISIVDNKSGANCLIKINPDIRTHWEMASDENGNIYKGAIFVNNENVFNSEEQSAYISEYLLHILGEFRFNTRMTPELALKMKINSEDYDETIVNMNTILKSRLNGYTDFDYKLMKFHYLKEIKAGINVKEFLELVKNIDNRKTASLY